jgi:hypothetical protein
VVTRGPLIAATRRDERWSVDFMHDQLQDGRRLRVLTVVDRYTREALATEARGSFSAHDVIDVLNRLSRSHRKPAVIQVDWGPFRGREILAALQSAPPRTPPWRSCVTKLIEIQHFRQAIRIVCVLWSIGIAGKGRLAWQTEIGACSLEARGSRVEGRGSSLPR